MNSCMVAHATTSEADAARVEWFTGREERLRIKAEERAAIERRRAEFISVANRVR
jgi:hypothetical protein